MVAISQHVNKYRLKHTAHALAHSGVKHGTHFSVQIRQSEQLVTKPDLN